MPRWDGGKDAAVDVEELLDATSLEYIQLLVARGGLVSIGTSKDGGALSVHVKAGDVKNREWFRDAEDLHEWLRAGCVTLHGEDPLGHPNVQPLRGA